MFIGREKELKALSAELSTWKKKLLFLFMESAELKNQR